MKGNVVVTSKEYDRTPIPFNIGRIEVLADKVVWTLKTEDDAIRLARFFCNNGFEYVRRLI